MDPIKRLLALSFISVSLLCSVGLAGARPEVLKQIAGFNRPVSAVFSEDGSQLFVLNHAQGEVGTLPKQSFLSRLTVDAAGDVAVDKMRFLDGLTAPIDMDFAPVAFGDAPAGSLFVVVGSPLVQDEAGRAMKDLSQLTVGLLIVDAQSGKILKSVDLSPNASIRLKGESSLLAPSSLCFDRRGNLYIGESGIGGHMFDRRTVGRPGIWRVDAKSVAEIVSGESPTQVEFIQTTSMPTDMCYRESDDMLYFTTNHTQGRPTGSIYMIPSTKFAVAGSMLTLARELDALSGLQIMPSGRVLLSGKNGELMFPKGKRATRPVRFHPKVDFSTPGKIALRQLAGGELLVAVPEQSSDAGVGKGQRIRIVKLSPN